MQDKQPFSVHFMGDRLDPRTDQIVDLVTGEFCPIESMEWSVTDPRVHLAQDFASAAILLLDRNWAFDKPLELLRSAGIPFKVIDMAGLSEDLLRPLGLANVHVFRDARSAAAEIAEFLRTVAAGGGRESSAVSTLRILEGDATEPTDWRMTPELARRLGYAIAINDLRPQDSTHRITFRSLCRAFFVGSEWKRFEKLLGAGLERKLAERLELRLLAGVNSPSVWKATSGERVSASTASILRLAQEHANGTKALLGERHVIGALLLSPHGHRDELQADWGAVLVLWADAFVEHISLRLPAEADYWSFCLGSTSQQPAQKYTPHILSIWDRPALANDRVTGAIAVSDDRLDASPQAERLAKLFVACDVKPPLALGLFGNWGSGKSFFMGLMKTHIERLTGLDSGGVYVKKAAQIEFNAWHYQDTNLWASLAVRIFEGLALELAKGLDGKAPESVVESKRREIHQSIRSTQAMRSDAQMRHDAAVKTRAETLLKLDDERKKRSEAEHKAQLLTGKAAWDAVLVGDAFKEARAKALALSAHFGFPALQDSYADMQRLRSDIEQTRARAHGLWGALGHRFRDGEGSVRTGGVVLLALLVTLAFGVGVHAIAQQLEFSLPELPAAIAQVTALVSAATAWCAKRVKQIDGALDVVEKVEADLAAKGKLVKPDEALEKEIRAHDENIRAESEVIATADRAIAEATAEIERINRGGLVYDFLQERRTSASYLGQLGLVSTIRQDLEQLASRLEDFQQHSDRPISRIVLYIDDLDRCHPDKVVEVLQAVHLLVAFPLFNVVVGVDPRWLERSLRRQYVGKVGTGRKQDQESFDPNDYLEKIFQIPYSLRPLEATGFDALVDDLVQSRDEWEKKRAASTNTLPSATNVEKPGPTDPNVKKPDEPGPIVAGGDKPVETHVPAPARVAIEKGLDVDKERAALFVENWEKEFMRRLSPFVERPRLAKRFANLYLLARLAAAEKQLTAFAGAESAAGYRATLVLLSILVRYGECAGRILPELRSRTDATLDAYLEALEKEPPSANWAPRQRADVTSIRAKLAALEGLPSALADYAPWVAGIACFSMHGLRAETIAPAEVL